MIKLIIFDLDNTLFDTYGQLGAKVLENMIKRMKRAGLTDEQAETMRKKYMQTGFRILARQMKLLSRIRKIGMDTYKSMDLARIKPFDDIKMIKDLPQEKALVTSGTKEVQMKKVEILGIKKLFNEIVVDEASSHKNKQKIFEKLMKKHHAKSCEVMVVGDNSESEIRAGSNLGMITVQMLRRPFLRGKADYYVKDLYEVKKILENERT